MQVDDVVQMAEAMRLYGGSFVKALGAAFTAADPTNMQRLLDAFPDYVQKYGPGSAPFKLAAQREAA